MWPLNVHHFFYIPLHKNIPIFFEQINNIKRWSLIWHFFMFLAYLTIMTDFLHNVPFPGIQNCINCHCIFEYKWEKTKLYMISSYGPKNIYFNCPPSIKYLYHVSKHVKGTFFTNNLKAYPNHRSVQDRVWSLKTLQKHPCTFLCMVLGLDAWMSHLIQALVCKHTNTQTHTYTHTHTHTYTHTHTHTSQKLFNHHSELESHKLSENTTIIWSSDTMIHMQPWLLQLTTICKHFHIGNSMVTIIICVNSPICLITVSRK